MTEDDFKDAVRRFPFLYIGKYHFDRASGTHWAESLRTGGGEPAEVPRVRLNYFGTPADSGFYENKVIAVSRAPNGAFFTTNDSVKYPQRRDQYAQIRDWNPATFDEAREGESFAAFLDRMARWNEDVIRLTPRFKCRSDAIVIADPDVRGRLYAGFHAAQDGASYVCESEEENVGDREKGAYAVFESTFSWADTEDAQKSPFFVLGQGGSQSGRFIAQPFMLDGESFFLVMPNSRHGIPIPSFYSAPQFWKAVAAPAPSVSSTPPVEKMLLELLEERPWYLDELSLELGKVRSPEAPAFKYPYDISHALERLDAQDLDRIAVYRLTGQEREFIGLRDGRREYWLRLDSGCFRAIVGTKDKQWAVGTMSLFDEGRAPVLENAIFVKQQEKIGSVRLLSVLAPDGDAAGRMPAEDLMSVAYERIIFRGTGEWNLVPETYVIRDMRDFEGLDFETRDAEMGRMAKLTGHLALRSASSRTPVAEHLLLRGRGGQLYGGFTYDPEKKTHRVGKVRSCALRERELLAIWSGLGFVYRYDGGSVVLAPEPGGFRIGGVEVWQDLEVPSSSARREQVPARTSGSVVGGYVQGTDGERTFLRALDEQCRKVGLRYSERTLACLHTAYKMQHRFGVLPVLAGPPGSGKSSLAELYASVAGMTYRKVFVSSGWNRPEDLVGWRSPVDKEYRPAGNGFYEALKAAAEDKTAEGKVSRPFHSLTLEEFNLAPVECWFADFIQLLSGGVAEPSVPNAPGDPTGMAGNGGNLPFGENFLLAGTLNDDATSYPPSDRVIDRCATIYIPRMPPGKNDFEAYAGVRLDQVEKFSGYSNRQEGLLGWIKEDLGGKPGPWQEKWTPSPSGGATPSGTESVEYHSIGNVYNVVVNKLRVEAGLVPSWRCLMHVKAYLLNRPGRAPSERAFQLQALDEALAIFLLPHRFRARKGLEGFLRDLFGEESFCADLIARRLKEQGEDGGEAFESVS